MAARTFELFASLPARAVLSGHTRLILTVLEQGDSNRPVCGFCSAACNVWLWSGKNWKFVYKNFESVPFFETMRISHSTFAHGIFFILPILKKKSPQQQTNRNMKTFKRAGEIGQWLRPQEGFQRTQVGFPALTWWFTTIVVPSNLHGHCPHVHTPAQKPIPQIQRLKNKIGLERWLSG